MRKAKGRPSRERVYVSWAYCLSVKRVYANGRLDVFF
jgi:hypothetical protein